MLAIHVERKAVSNFWVIRGQVRPTNDCACRRLKAIGNKAVQLLVALKQGTLPSKEMPAFPSERCDVPAFRATLTQSNN